MATLPATQPPPGTLTSISPLLKKLSQSSKSVTGDEVTAAISHIFNNSLSPVQATAFLTALHFTHLDEHPEIIAAAARGMRDAGVKIHGLESRFPVPSSSRKDTGVYNGGLVDIVGTGGDGHDTFNVSTTSAILATACGIQVCKHGNKASTSTSGSADILTALGADLTNIDADKVRDMFCSDDTTTIDTNTTTGTFCFLFAPIFHPAMKNVAPIRTSLPFKTIFNLLGPLVNPIDYSHPHGLEARIIGVGNPRFGRVFAETLVLLGITRAMVVSGFESLDEISPAVNTHVWKIRKSQSDSTAVIEQFILHPTTTFGLRTHPLSRVAGGKAPQENAKILKRLITGQIDPSADTDERAILDFVMLNTAALVVVAGVVGDKVGERWEEEEEVNEEGVVIGQKWRDAIEVVREGVKSGRAWNAWEKFAEWSRKHEGVISKEKS